VVDRVIGPAGPAVEKTACPSSPSRQRRPSLAALSRASSAPNPQSSFPSCPDTGPGFIAIFTRVVDAAALLAPLALISDFAAKKAAGSARVCSRGCRCCACCPCDASQGDASRSATTAATSTPAGSTSTLSAASRPVTGRIGCYIRGRGEGAGSLGKMVKTSVGADAPCDTSPCASVRDIDLACAGSGCRLHLLLVKYDRIYILLL